MQLRFRKWCEETAGEDHSRINSECPGFGRSRYGADAYPKIRSRKLRDERDKKRNSMMGFMGKK